MGAALGIGLGVAGMAVSGYGASQAGRGTQTPQRGYEQTARRHLTHIVPLMYQTDRHFGRLFTRQQAMLARRAARMRAQTLARLQPMVNELERGRVSGELGLVREMGPETMAAMRAARPGGAALMDTLEKEAQNDLNLGVDLDPRELRQVQQNVRMEQTGRGFGQGSINDRLQEALALTLAGRDVLEKRRGFAGNVVAQGQEFWGDPWAKLYGGSGATPLSATGLAGMGDAGVRHIPMEAPGGATAQPFGQPGQQANAMMAMGGGMMGAGGELAGAYWNSRRPQTNNNYWGGGY